MEEPVAEVSVEVVEGNKENKSEEGNNGEVVVVEEPPPPKETTNIIDEISGPSGITEKSHVVVMRPSIKPQTRKPTQQKGKSFEQLQKEEEERKKQESEPRRLSLANQEFSDPLGILEEYKKAKDSGNLADEALNAQAAFAAKAAERKKKIELESSKSNVNKDKIMEIYNSGKPLMEGELLKKTRTGAWNTRKFQLIKNELIWLRSDENKHNFLNVAVDGASVRDVKIGAKKFMFEVCVPSPGFNVMLSASSEEEKKKWMEMIQFSVDGPRPLPGAAHQEPQEMQVINVAPISPKSEGQLGEEGKKPSIGNMEAGVKVNQCCVIF